jgi:NitT/TauT family transport system permease protein
MFAVLLVIVLIGVLQDWLFYALDRFFFPFKHVQKNKR